MLRQRTMFRQRIMFYQRITDLWAMIPPQMTGRTRHREKEMRLRRTPRHRETPLRKETTPRKQADPNQIRLPEMKFRKTFPEKQTA